MDSDMEKLPSSSKSISSSGDGELKGWGSGDAPIDPLEKSRITTEGLGDVGKQLINKEQIVLLTDSEVEEGVVFQDENVVLDRGEETGIGEKKEISASGKSSDDNFEHVSLKETCLDDVESSNDENFSKCSESDFEDQLSKQQRLSVMKIESESNSFMEELRNAAASQVEVESSGLGVVKVKEMTMGKSHSLVEMVKPTAMASNMDPELEAKLKSQSNPFLSSTSLDDLGGISNSENPALISGSMEERQAPILTFGNQNQNSPKASDFQFWVEQGTWMTTKQDEKVSEGELQKGSEEDERISPVSSISSGVYLLEHQGPKFQAMVSAVQTGNNHGKQNTLKGDSSPTDTELYLTGAPQEFSVETDEDIEISKKKTKTRRSSSSSFESFTEKNWGESNEPLTGRSSVNIPATSTTLKQTMIPQKNSGPVTLTTPLDRNPFNPNPGFEGKFENLYFTESNIPDEMFKRDNNGEEENSCPAELLWVHKKYWNGNMVIPEENESSSCCETDDQQPGCVVSHLLNPEAKISAEDLMVVNKVSYYDLTRAENTESLTESAYDETYMGRTEVFRPTLTPEERGMLGIQNPPDADDEVKVDVVFQSEPSPSSGSSSVVRVEDQEEPSSEDNRSNPTNNRSRLARYGPLIRSRCEVPVDDKQDFKHSPYRRRPFSDGPVQYNSVRVPAENEGVASGTSPPMKTPHSDKTPTSSPSYINEAKVSSIHQKVKGYYSSEKELKKELSVKLKEVEIDKKFSTSILKEELEFEVQEMNISFKNEISKVKSANKEEAYKIKKEFTLNKKSMKQDACKGKFRHLIEKRQAEKHLIQTKLQNKIQREENKLALVKVKLEENARKKERKLDKKFRKKWCKLNEKMLKYNEYVAVNEDTLPVDELLYERLLEEDITSSRETFGEEGTENSYIN